MTKIISLDVAAALTGMSRSTVWRRLQHVRASARGRGVALHDLLPLIPLALSRQEQAVVHAAVQGDLEAQDDLGQMFVQKGKPRLGIHWLRTAAERGYPNAMHVLGSCYSSGLGVDQDRSMALMWIARAAAAGHAIAQAQVGALLARLR